MKEYQLDLSNGETKVFDTQTAAEDYIENYVDCNPNLRYALYRVDNEKENVEFLDGNMDENEDEEDED